MDDVAYAQLAKKVQDKTATEDELREFLAATGKLLDDVSDALQAAKS